MKRFLVLVSLAIVFALLIPAPAARAAKLRIGYSAITATMAPLWAAHEMDFFAKHGIEGELIYLAGGSRIALALEADSIQLAQIALNRGVEARLAGSDILIVASVYDTYYFQSLPSRRLRTRRSSKGKVIAGSSPGAASEYGIRDALRSVGLKDN